jgi:RimJ/RimL family protein N-acetyltransferase
MVATLEMSADTLPRVVASGADLTIRHWVVTDAEALSEAIAGSIEHLRPWMPWVAKEPLTVVARRSMIDGWEHDRAAGKEAHYCVLVRGGIAGAGGLHRRIGPGGLEIGYWIRPGFLRRGLATECARLMTDAAFTLPGTTHVEIHHDRANVASGNVPRKLGFRLVAEVERAPEAPAETGVAWWWRVDRREWLDGRSSS